MLYGISALSVLQKVSQIGAVRRRCEIYPLTLFQMTNEYIYDVDNDSLNLEIDELCSSFQLYKFNYDKYYLDSHFQKLFNAVDKWKQTMIARITKIHAQKREEIRLCQQQTVKEYEKQRIILNEQFTIQMKQVNIERNDFELLKSKLKLLKDDLGEMKQEDKCKAIPFDYEQDEKRIKNQPITKGLFKLQSCQTFELDTEYTMMASCDSSCHLLLHDGKYLKLFSSESLLSKLDLQLHGPQQPRIIDMYWSNELEKYLILYSHSLWQLDSEMSFEIKKFFSLDEKYLSLTINGQDLYLLNDKNNIERWMLTKDTCQQMRIFSNFEAPANKIEYIRSSPIYLVSIIRNTNNNRRSLCIRDFSMKLIRRLVAEWNIYSISYFRDHQWFASTCDWRLYYFIDDDDDNKFVNLHYIDYGKFKVKNACTTTFSSGLIALRTTYPATLQLCKKDLTDQYFCSIF
ncbi:unnamed protein product [Didymodactylos carnosus]|uniref:Uncharacterized protein n=1 Tax=Didymodactylos carnosus TaxID=1234261 RepID=A0A816AFE4_9BILA|nr:unnamed protein product [Didymodactylos carnosus]CAF4467936.1 unnamed protein product [Didymodactylos carnosus]